MSGSSKKRDIYKTRYGIAEDASRGKHAGKEGAGCCVLVRHNIREHG